MDVNELRRKVYKTIFDTCVKLDSKDVGGDHKCLEYRPGRNELFWVVAENNGAVAPRFYCCRFS